MNQFKLLNNVVGWLVFAIAATVYASSAEPTGSLWDCGEFIAGAYKLQVVHPPGAPLFLLIGRLFTYVAELVSGQPADIAYSVNLMSGISTAFAAMFVAWSTTIIARLTLVGRDDSQLTLGQSILVLGAGLVAGLTTTFATSIWFSAVEGEVYAMSTFFTTLVMWAGWKWYQLPDNKETDKWLVFAAYMAGLSIGVHLLSLLTFPLLAILYYHKKYKAPTFFGMLIAAAAGFGVLVLVQGIIILKLPGIGASFDHFFVNDLGLPFYSGFLFFIILLTAAVCFGIYWTHQKVRPNLQKAIVAFAMVLVGFSTYGVIVLRAYANTPINMNNPSDVYSFVSYLNREQYGDRPLLYGPHFDATPIGQDITPKYGVKGERYDIVDRKIDYKYNPSDYMLFPRIGHYDRPEQHRQWMNGRQGKPTMGDNLNFFFRYQINWMYWRYFMWNFVGRQNGEQGYFPWDPRSGNWISGISFIDNARLFNQEHLPDSMKKQAHNTYYFLPLLFGLLGLVFHFNRSRKNAWALLVLFLMTGLAIIVYSNQPPNEPRERDYVLAGSIFAFSMWIGLGVVALGTLMKERFKLPDSIGAVVATLLVLTAPLVMAFQNWDDHNRSEHTGSRDYAVNFLESCAPNAIIFTHGDNDTYPLWYAQEVEGIRTDVRVVNLSLLAVDWYINQLRRKVNNSPKIKMSIPEDAYRGYERNRLVYAQNPAFQGFSPISSVVQFMGNNNNPNARNGQVSYLPTKNISIPVNPKLVIANKTVLPQDTGRVVPTVNFTIPKNDLMKDEIAILDIIASNNWERPIYFAVTCRPEKALGLQDYLQLEGMGLRLVPVQNKSNPRYGFIGSGGVAEDLMLDNITQKFRWGNFDKEELYVDKSYMPSIYSMRVGIIRLVENFLLKNENEKAIKALDQYFKAYPAMNFPFENTTLPLLQAYFNAGAPEKASPHVIEYAKESAQRLKFYDSLQNAKSISAFSNERKDVEGGILQVANLVQSKGSKELQEQYFNILKDWLPAENPQNQPPTPQDSLRR